MDQQEYFFTCPYCWESISMLLDTSVEAQTFVEDCEVCCHPIEIRYTSGDGEITHFETVKLQ